MVFFSKYEINNGNEQLEEEADEEGDGSSKVIRSRTGIGEMAGFLKEYPMYTEFNYKWNLSVEKKIIMLADAPRVEYHDKKKDKKEKVIHSGNLNDFFGDSAKKINKIKRKNKD